MGVGFGRGLWLWFGGGRFALRDPFEFRRGLLFERRIVKRGSGVAYNDSPGAADVLALVPFVAALVLGLGLTGAAECSHIAETRGVRGTCLMLRAWR